MSARARVLVQLSVAVALLTVAAAPPAAADRGSAVPLRIATYNIHAGTGSDGVFDLDRQATALRALDADVIGLQEVDVHWGARSGDLDVAGELARRLGMRVSFAPIYSLDPVTAQGPRREYGVAVLSRFPVRAAANHEITRLSTQDEDPVPAPAPGFGEVTLKVRGVPVQVFVTHLDYRADPAVRVAQVADTRRIMAQERAARPGARQVLLGDFNAEPSAPELGPLWRELRDAAAGAPGTYPAADPVKRIDYVAVGRGVRVRGVSVPEEAVASDHRPVVAELTLVRGAGRR
ncbi:endonuclease/exonuclease/phosphatase family protein [Streptomyces olivaceus]|uniref:Endonuclease/exonuclease/phosphatase family protein n=1 Tax=Streptomyces olivaceus TaxID=47716 RepID=A0ABS7W3P6_STROV|nr:endonuclease/exonuclease/phosphatase family protein [Streptomyces olivaceus]MBZ6089790.1 endonuclease/exonuclease/phosphatase family protein [Streptomyces olivaceus]MBZ6098301.1 endonuclease/exonuclease/phosphatase family protein [Streptomyces olivaceus]MBZ6119104.1 endonuclease/exonuclease/phosphatase family protein [Streptomyces olivaceus]MBZ6152164.1 endonuclease/exonuclease/phosphatase family protein [Streptomyces olivaceus]MBZ6300714.1 endonuclease/exonuclease/phosphatase family protei